MMSDLLEQIYECFDRAGVRAGVMVTDQVIDSANVYDC